MPALIAVDAGTTGVRAFAVDGEGRPLGFSYRELTQYFPRPGWVEHDPEEIWTAVQTTLAELAGRLAGDGVSVAAVGITNQRETVVAWDRDYLGPAALNRAWTLVNDVRDAGDDARLAAVSGDSGCQACHTHMSCTSFCPKAIAPTYSIAGLKRAMFWHALKGVR